MAMPSFMKVATSLLLSMEPLAICRSKTISWFDLKTFRSKLGPCFGGGFLWRLSESPTAR